MNKLTVKDIDVKRKRVLVRVDFNVPIDEKTGAISDDNRIQAAVPTINYLVERGAKVILISHLGRPKGKVVESMRLTPIARRLAEILKKPVATAKDCIGTEVEKQVAALKDGEILMLENVRFHAEEEAGDKTFAQKLAKLGDLFVNDAFGTCHRAHASVSVIAEFLPAVAGFLVEKEIETLGGILENPAHPFTALLGGAKVSDKVALLDNVMGKIDCLLIGGGMAATFLKAKSVNIGASMVEADRIETAAKLMDKATKNKVRLLLPLDVVVADEISATAKSLTVAIDKIPANKKILDIGPRTVEAFGKEISRSKTVFWNGPMGVNEIPQFAGGTLALAKLLAASKVKSIIGGGSTAEVIGELGLSEKVTFVSTGGGASLEFLGGEPMPGIAALLDKNSKIKG
ncbi:MAG: phosphoglycerate kinase [Dehalococcoidales bacterium]|nr:phosphoglycerate kinase [Dehalococcoidales bacterium]